MLNELGRLLRSIVDGPDPASLPAPGEVIPTLPVMDADPSFEYSRGSYMFEGYAIESAGAGARSHVGLWNPFGSGVVAVVTRLWATTTGLSLTMTVGTNAQAAVMDSDGNEHATDTRLRVGTYVSRPNTCQIVTDTAAQIGTVVTRISPAADDAAANYLYHHPMKFVLFPGAVLIVLPSYDNTSIQCSYRWSERRYEVMELQGTRKSIFA